MQLMQWQNKSTAKLQVRVPNKLLKCTSVWLAAFMIVGCASKKVETPPTPQGQLSVSLETLNQGLAYIREHPATREEEQVQRYLWLDTWVRNLQERDRLTPEMSQEYWNDFDSFLKTPPATISSLDKILARVQSRLGRNVALYSAYQESLKNQRLEDALKHLERVEEDGTTGLFARAQEILQLNSFQPTQGSRKVGVLLPLSGELKGFAQEALLGIQIASRMAIADGVEFIIEDSGSNLESLNHALQKLAVNENVTAVIGPLTAKESEAAFERAELLRVPVISLAAKEDLKTYGNYSFRSLLSIDDQVKALADFISRELRSRRVAVLSPDSNYGWDVMDRAGREFNRRGIEIAQMRVYPQGATDFKEQLREMVLLDSPRLRKDEVCAKVNPKDKNAVPQTNCVKRLNDLRPIVDFDTLFVPDFAETVGLILPTLPYLRIYGVQVVGLSGLNSKRLIERAGPSADGAIFTDSYIPNSDSYANSYFRSEFSKVASREPSRVAAEAFDLAVVTLSIMTKDERAVSRDLFIDRLRRIESFEGVTGSITYSDQKLLRKPEFLVVRDQEIRKMN